MNYLFLLVVLTVASVNLALVKSNRTPLTDDQLTNNGYNYTDLGDLFNSVHLNKTLLEK